METFDVVMNAIRQYAMQVYPDELLYQYQVLEKSCLESNEKEKQQAVQRIRKIKNELKMAKPKVEWETFFAHLEDKVEHGDNISIADIITTEYAPPETAHHLLSLARAIAKRRNELNGENTRLCKSIYGFTTCLNPCAYGSYGSCLFAARRDNEPSIAEKMFGNITTVDEYVNEIRAAKTEQHANNVKLITTSHKVDSNVLEVVTSAIKKTRRDENIKDIPICVSLGSVDEEQILKLKEAGATRVNHNLETSYFNALFLASIASNKDNGKLQGQKVDSVGEYKKRLTTVVTALKNEMTICSGGMFFYGDDEIPEDRILLYLTLNELDKIWKTNSSPFNVFVPLKDIIDESVGWFNAFGLSCVDRSNSIDGFAIFKTLVTFALIVPPRHKIMLNAGSKWFGEEWFSLAMELGGGAGLASYLQQVNSHRTVEIAQLIDQNKLL
ncbi:hypothetical protein KIAC18_002122 [Sporomusa sphaeroides]|uniref:hypothetical protein n=1 Tax=Sporomusa sphaeroides TaxID=47679 RepID=UPI003DA1BBC5